MVNPFEAWEVRVTAPNGDHATILIPEQMIEFSLAWANHNRYAAAASLSVYEFANIQQEAINANTKGETDQHYGRSAGGDQAS